MLRGPVGPVYTHRSHVGPYSATSGRQHHRVPHPRRCRRALRLQPGAGRDRRHRHGTVAVGDRRPRSEPGTRRVRRSNGAVHRVTVRGQRSPRCHRRDSVGRATTRRPCGRQQTPPARADDVDVCRADRVHQRQRGRRRTRSGGRRHGGQIADTIVAVDDSAGVRCPCRIDVDPHRLAGERAGVGGGRRGRCQSVRLLRVRPRWCPATRRHGRDRRHVRQPLVAAPQRSFHACRLQRTSPCAARALRARPPTRWPAVQSAVGRGRGHRPPPVGADRERRRSPG